MKDLLTLACTVFLIILIPGCAWLSIVLYKAYRRQKRLEKVLGKNKIILDPHEIEIGN